MLRRRNNLVPLPKWWSFLFFQPLLQLGYPKAAAILFVFSLYDRPIFFVPVKVIKRIVE